MALNVEVQGHVAIATLNRPEARNALNRELRGELTEFWTRLRNDQSIRAAVLTGAGDVAFCAGSDLKDTSLDRDYLDEAFGGDADRHFMRGPRLETPIVCAVNGHALGGGLELALACDIRLAATNATFAMPEVRVGSMPGAGGTQYLSRAIASSDAMYLLLTGQPVTAQEALHMRLVTQCVELPHLLDRAVQIAETIAANAPLSLRATKRMASAAFDLPLQHGIDQERTLWGILKGSRDRAEGRRAFREGRPPRFEGR